MKFIIKPHKKLIRFVISMVMTALLCVTSPTFAKIPKIVSNSPAIAQNQSVSSLEEKARTYYQQGNFSEAAKFFLQAAEAYKTSSNPIRQALNLSNLSLCYQKLGEWEDANRVILASIDLLNKGKTTTTQGLLALAQSLGIKGNLQLTQGNTNAALESWETVADIYIQLNKPTLLLVNQIKQAQALQNLGFYRRAIPLLSKTLNLPEILDSNEKSNIQPVNIFNNTEKYQKFQTQLAKAPASPETVIALRILGDSFRTIGKFKTAEIVLKRSLNIATQLKLDDGIALANLSLGTNIRLQTSSNNKKPENKNLTTSEEKAFDYYQKAGLASSGNIRVKSQLNQLSLITDKKIGLLDKPEYQATAKNLLSQVKQEIEILPPNRSTIQARINLANTMMAIGKKIPEVTSYKEIAQTLAVAVEQAKELGNPRTLSYALGTLGSIYEQTQQWKESQKLTEQALQLAQQTHAGDIAYIWQWQLGRVTKAQGDNKSAIAAYKEAVGTIKSLRADLAVANPDLQFSFKDAIEPIHREFVTLLVESNQQDNLETARNVIEGLQLVELDNFFRQACLNADPKQVDNVDEKSAVIYPIILEKQLAIIASLPKAEPNLQKENKKKRQREFRYYKTPISREDIENQASSLGELLRQDNTLPIALPQLQEMYNLIIRPEAEDLKTSGVKTLVFVLDGVLRNIPMTALHDGEKYLIEDYSVALTPGLQLLSPQRLQQQSLKALVGGLSESRQDFPPLPHVKKEVSKVSGKVPSQVLFNKQFTNPAFQNKVSAAPFPVVHLATHGQFGSTAEDTFIVTWDGKVNVNDLSGTLKTAELSQENSLELLVLSACETAAGDDRSALGLAGVAVRSGARRTIATLWKVNDESSAALMSTFYEQLLTAKETGVSKAEALRQAQIQILKNSKYQSPYYWAAYVLLGNWT